MFSLCCFLCPHRLLVKKTHKLTLQREPEGSEVTHTCITQWRTSCVNICALHRLSLVWSPLVMLHLRSDWLLGDRSLRTFHRMRWSCSRAAASQAWAAAVLSPKLAGTGCVWGVSGVGRGWGHAGGGESYQVWPQNQKCGGESLLVLSRWTFLQTYTGKKLGLRCHICLCRLVLICLLLGI